MIELCGDVKDKTIVDAGCGEGYITRILKEKGAKVIGVDISSKMINTARKQNNEINFIEGDVLKLSNFIKKSVDKVLSVMVFTYFNREQIDTAITESAKILKIGGEIIVGTTHSLLGMEDIKSGWIDIKSPENTNYHTDFKYPVFIYNKDGQVFSTSSVHVPLEEFIKPFYKNSLLIEDIIEPFPREEDLKKYPEKWGAEKVKPIFLIIKARKIASI